jgi:uncharacterized surface anchored protein
MALTLLVPLTGFASGVDADTGGEVADTDAAPDESGAGGGIVALSGWEDGGSEFFTKIRLTATDRSGNPIQGVVYGLYRADDDTLAEYLTTDRYGVAMSNDVPVETNYYLVEYAAPEGFLPNTEPKYIDLEEICAPSRVDEYVVYDPITGYIKVIKTDEDGYPMPGVGFYVYRSDTWDLVDTIYTDSYGEAVTTLLPYGGYELYEFDYPDDMAGGGYYSWDIEYDGETHEVYITNYRARGDVYVSKTGNDGRRIQGAVFSVYHIGPNGDEWVEDITTSSSGYAYSSYLPLGGYYLIEKSVPPPYVLDGTRHDFVLYYDNQTAYFDLTNDREGENGQIRVIKTDDSASPVPLPGVVFGLYRAWDGRKLTELTTGADGTAEYSLIPDDYYLVELSGKTGYTMASGQIPFTIDGSGDPVEKIIVNPKIRIFGKVKVIKTDDAGQPIPGVRFGVYCQAGNLLEEITTGVDGTATSGVLNEGTGYYLMELEGVPGYLSDAEAQYPFSITANNVIVPVNVTNPRVTGGVRIVKDDGGGNPLSGVVFGIYKDGVKLTELITSGDGTATSGSLYYGGDYELRELSTVDGYELITTPIPFSILEQDVIIEIPVSNPLILGGVTVIKVDAEDMPQENAAQVQSLDGIEPSPMAGAVFGLYNDKGQKIAELTVDETGRASYYGLPKSGYYLKEQVAPEGFVLLDELIPFSINEQGEDVEIVVPNARGFGEIKIIKSGQGLPGGENEMLPGVVFEVYSAANDGLLMELTTGEDGTATQELPLGRYYLMEKSTVPGYSPMSGPITFTLTTEGATVELSLQNQREPAPEGGNIRLIKTDATDGERRLPGAVFGVYRVSDDEKVAELVTGSDGTATSPALPELEQGYYLRELAAPALYEPLAEPIPVEVRNGETVEITVENTPSTPAPDTGNLEIIKKSDTGVRLQGAVFGVYRASDDQKITELTTDLNGRATYELAGGDYYCKELRCDGYALIPGKLPVRVAAGETKTLTVTNTPLDAPADPPGTLKIIKESEGGERLSGAVFGVYRKSDDKKVAEITTDENGEASVKLPENDYYCKELAAPEGFRLSTEKTAFHIASGTVKEITVINRALPDEDMGRVLIVKKAAGTGRLLEDAVFGVYLASGDEKVAELTTGSGGEASVSLPLSSYYLKELRAPSGGYVPETAKIPFRLTAEGVTVKVEVTNTQGRGTVRLVKTGAEGEAVSGAVFNLFRQDGTLIAELISGKDGVAVYDLPIGSFYLVEKAAAVGYRLDTRRYGFDIANGKTTDVKIVNQKIQGTVEIYFRHVQDGRELAPAQSLTANVGTDYIRWMRSNGYENMPIGGYTLLRTDYPSSFAVIDGKLVVTLWYDSPASTGVTIPKTGEAPPYGNYILAALCIGIAGMCGVMLYRGRRKRKSV